MRGYVSFLLVFAGSAVLLSMLLLAQQSSSIDLSKAVAVERAGALHMNVKESLLESVRQGASMGYGAYDAAHDVRLCKHCPDNACAPPTPLDPVPPNVCDASLCSRCFRENEERAAAVSGAIGSAALLNAHQFDADSTIALGEIDVEAFLRSEPTSKNGFALDFIRFRDDLRIETETSRFGVVGSSRIPKGTVVRYG